MQKARKLIKLNTSADDAISLDYLKYFVDAHWLEYFSSVFLMIFSTIINFMKIKWSSTFEPKERNNKNSVTVKALNDTVRKELRISMYVKNAWSGIENLFTSYMYPIYRKLI